MQSSFSRSGARSRLHPSHLFSGQVPVPVTACFGWSAAPRLSTQPRRSKEIFSPPKPSSSIPAQKLIAVAPWRVRSGVDPTASPSAAAVAPAGGYTSRLSARPRRRPRVYPEPDAAPVRVSLAGVGTVRPTATVSPLAIVLRVGVPSASGFLVRLAMVRNHFPLVGAGQGMRAWQSKPSRRRSPSIIASCRVAG